MSGLGWGLPGAALLAAFVALLRLRRSPLRRLRQPRAPGSADLRLLGRRLARRATRDPGRLTAAAVVTAAGLGLLLGGPVAAVVLGAYSTLGVRGALRSASDRRVRLRRSRRLDDLCALTAELRAGLPPQRAGEVHGDDRLAELTGAVWRLAERTGAPAADLVERIESDARAADRAAASAGAQAAGARATAVLLAALPIGGIGLGYSIGTDPLRILLHTRLGAGCALGALLLQFAGLLWCDRLVAGAKR